MHELSIAQNIVGIVRESVSPDELADVRVVKVRLGVLSGVAADSLDFCFMAILADTPLSAAKLKFEHVPFIVHCPRCVKSFTNEVGMVVCPDCGNTATRVLSGRELQVMEIELESEEKII